MSFWSSVLPLVGAAVGTFIAPGAGTSIGYSLGSAAGAAAGGSGKKQSAPGDGVWGSGGGSGLDWGDFLGKYGGDIIGAGTAIYGTVEANKARKKANAENEKRYNDIIALLGDQGKASRVEVKRSGEEERDKAKSSLVSRGMYSTSLLDTLNNASYEREGRAQTAIDEAVANRVAGVMERRTDAAPDSDVAALAQTLGQSLFTGRGGQGNNVADDLLSGLNGTGGTGKVSPARSAADPIGGGSASRPAAAVGYQNPAAQTYAKYMPQKKPNGTMSRVAKLYGAVA